MSESPQPFLPYGRQTIEDDDVAAVAEVLRSDFLTTGPTVGRFEADLARAVGAKYAVACANGTAALYMAARALQLRPGCKVIVPAVTFLATANAPHLCGADIVFADVDPESGLMRPQDLIEALNRAGRVDALFNVHLNGQCGALDEISTIARAHGIWIVDDGCHALGTGYRDRNGVRHRVGDGTHADMTVFSFHPVKTVTTGEGGAIVTRDVGFLRALKLARNHGMTREADEFVQAGDGISASGEANPWYYEMHAPELNFRITDVQCALGVSQLKKLGRFAARRRALTALYDTLLAPFAPHIVPIWRNPDCDPVLHLYPVLIDFAGLKIERAEAMKKLAALGIGTQVHYFPVCRQPYYVARYGMSSLPGADSYYARVLSLPFYPALRESDVERVCTALKEVFLG